jgi:hypothetical protein
MFPRFREQIGTALDLIVEFSTLGEYRLGAYGATAAAGAPAEAPGHASQLGGAGPRAARAADRRTVAGGPAGAMPVATPAARRPPSAECRRRSDAAPSARLSGPARRVRAGAPAPPEQLCLGL